MICGIRVGMVVRGEGMDSRALRIVEVAPRRTGKGSDGGEVCGVNVVSSGASLGLEVEMSCVDIEGNWGIIHLLTFST